MVFVHNLAETDVTVDLSTREMQEQLTQRDAEIERLSGILAGLDEGIIMQDTEGRIVVVNTAARELLGSQKSFWETELGTLFKTTLFNPDSSYRSLLQGKVVQYAGDLKNEVNQAGPNQDAAGHLAMLSASLTDGVRQGYTELAKDEAAKKEMLGMVVDIALAGFDAVLGDKPNQIDKQRPDVEVSAADLLDAGSTPGDITEDGLRNDVSVGFQYISFWLGGRGAAGINNMMEDAATAEISRSQIWQWVKHGKFTRDEVRRVLDEETQKIHDEVGDEVWEKGRPDETREIFESVSLSDEFPEFLTIPAYEYLD